MAPDLQPLAPRPVTPYHPPYMRKPKVTIEPTGDERKRVRVTIPGGFYTWTPWSPT